MASDRGAEECGFCEGGRVYVGQPVEGTTLRQSMDCPYCDGTGLVQEVER